MKMSTEGVPYKIQRQKGLLVCYTGIYLPIASMAFCIDSLKRMDLMEVRFLSFLVSTSVLLD
jgi:hypothetical protein